MSAQKEKVLVGMSGGVDSSVAAFLLLQDYEVIGATMKLYSNAGATNPCCSLAGAEEARRVAAAMGIRHYMIDFQSLFHQAVLEDFLRSYRRGETPTPCYRCNQFIKFDAFLKQARKLGISKIATGHYARKVYNEQTGRYELWRPADREKDQTYFLACLTQPQLSSTLFPLAELKKEEVRKIAQRFYPRLAHKRESQDLCFVGAGGTRAYLQEKIGETPGDIVTTEGKVLGRHLGVAFYTIGQRRGLGVARGQRTYVVDLLPDQNLVVVGKDEDLKKRSFLVRDVNWISIESPSEALECEVQVRYRQTPCKAVIFPEGEAMVRCEVSVPLRAVTPGQAAVFYQGDRVLGGGIISRD